MRNERARGESRAASSRPQAPLLGVVSPAVAAPAVGGVVARWQWARHWEFWLAVALAAFLRLWRSDLAQFLDDQAGLMRLARAGILQGALPVASIPSSVGTLNPPLNVYLLMPFAYFSQNPLPAVISIAVWNVLGVALCYPFALRYFGRRDAATAALLFATCGAAVNYSRFIWPQNYLPPLTVLWAITLYAGCVLGRKRWFVANATLLLLMALLHPVAALLIPVTIIGVFLAPQRPRWWEYAVFALIAGILLAPSLIWEYLSGASDLRRLAHFATGQGTFDFSIFHNLYLALGAPGFADFGPTSLFYPYRQITPVINIVAALVFVVGYLALTLRVWRPALAIWRTTSPTPAPADANGAQGADHSAPTFALAYRRATPRGRLGLAWRWALAVYRGLRAKAGWRAEALLWLWVSVPLAALIHHSSPLYVHYLILLYPAAFLVAGFGAQDVPRWLAGRQRARRSPFALLGEGIVAPPGIATAAPRWATVVVGMALVALVAAQAAQSSLYTASIRSPGFQAFVGYGYPLSAVQQLDSEITTLERQQGATNVVILTAAPQRYRAALEYLLVSEHPDRVSLTENCLLLSAPSAGPTLIVDAVAPGTVSQAADLLPGLPNVRRAGSLPILGSAPLQAYLAQGATPTLPGEAPLAVSYRDQQGDGLTLLGAAPTAPGVLRLRWRIDTAPAGHWFRVAAQSSGQPTAGVSAATAQAEKDDCQPTRWSSGETLFTWTSYPTTTPGALTISLAAGTLGLDAPTLGPLRFLADTPPPGALVPLAPSGAPLALPA